MKRPSALVFFLLAVSLAKAADAPASVAELFATPENLQVVRRATKIDACLLRHVEALVRPDGSIDRSTERYEETSFVSVPPDVAARLKDLLAHEKTYDWKASSGGRRPQFYLRLRFQRGEEAVAVDFCFLCQVLRLTGHGAEIGHANFRPNADLILQALLKVFPDDQPLRGLAKESGLPL